MRYLKFNIQNYRAIDGPMEIDLSKESLFPIIGVNECGKTTILHALFAFDHNNDELNSKGRHLQDVTNLYSVSPKDPLISADIAITFDEFIGILKDISGEDATTFQSSIRSYKRLRNRFPDSVRITRNLRTLEYSLEESLFFDRNLNKEIATSIIRGLPFLLYFDDFRDSVENRVEIAKPHTKSGWLAIFETLFKKTDPSFSVFSLPEKEERYRKTILAKVNRKLNDTLTREWQNFRLDDVDALRIVIDYDEENVPPSSKRHYLKIDVIETDASGDDHYFFVRDRSKGFFWFFNFVMKLEFNPKVVKNTDVDAIYLLDEPGSYLHASAQSKLARKLRNLSTSNKVIYCTHSHHLLDPEIIPINSIRIAEKDGHGNVKLVSIHEHRGSITERRSAYQPLIDALQIRPLAFDFGHSPVIVTEGIYDFYLFELFKSHRNVTILPSVGAQSMKFYISLMIAWRISYCAFWDNDSAGRESFAEASSYFGEVEANTRFRLLPLIGKAKKRVLSDLIDGSDLVKLRQQLTLPKNTSLEKTIAGWYYSQSRTELTQGLSKKTHQNFADLFTSLPLTLTMEG